MKRTAMNRSRKPINAVSKKRASTAAAYTALREEKLRRFPRCQLGPRIRQEHPEWRGCTVRATELHHLRKQGDGGARVSDANTLTSCNRCNAGWVEDHPREAHALGLVVRFGDPGFDDLGVRAERLRGFD